MSGGILAKHKAEQRYGAVFQASVIPGLWAQSPRIPAADPAKFDLTHAAMTRFSFERTPGEEAEAKRLCGLPPAPSQI